VANAVSGNNVVGSYFDGNTDRAFVYDGSAFTTLDGPGGFGSEANGVSGATVVGDYLDPFVNNHGFLYNGSTFTTLDVPGAVATIPKSVDGSSPSRPKRKGRTGPSQFSVAGTYYDVNNAAHAFLYDGSSFTTIDAPGASDTYGNSVSGDTVVGSYYDPVSGSNYGYLFSPSPSAVPEPGSLALLGVAAAGLMGCAWRRRGRTISLP
jgi:hypothetical protein